MQRRQILGSTGAVALAALAVNAMAQQPAPATMDHSHHMHHGGSPYAELIRSSSECVSTGEACLAHCLVLLADGDKAMAECAQSVNQLLAICTALGKLAAQNSKMTRSFAKLALDACTECEKSCRKHADKHAECKACAQACTDCIKQCKAVTA